MQIPSAGIHMRNIRVNTYKIKKREYLPQYWSDKCFKGTIINLCMESHLNYRGVCLKTYFINNSLSSFFGFIVKDVYP